MIWVWIWLLFAIASSAVWGGYGVSKEFEGSSSGKEKLIQKIGIFFSEFVGSLAGWGCLYIYLLRNWHDKFASMSGVDIFLILGTVIGIAGYSYQIVRLLEAYATKLTKQAQG